MLKMLRRIIGENIRIAVEQGAPKIWIHADPGMIDQVVMNLCVNARDAMPHGGGLRLSTGLTHLEEGAPLPHPEARPGDFVCLGVQDSGCGMSEEVLQHAFEPFFTTKGVGKGTGLGLSTVHGIVSQHRGWVQVQSTPGRGTHFQVFLPLAQEPEKSELRASPTSFLGGSETLLVVEDEAVVRHAISTRLRKLGYQVVEASNGREALEHWAKQAAEIHLLFTDMVMPEGMTGIELAQALRAQNPGLRVIISSGYSAEIMNASDPSLKGCGFLAKPFSVEALAEMVRKTLDGRV
jgi:CheY-like chemotaxis protein